MSKKPPRIDRVTMRSGDSGKTSLADGKRYSKSHSRVELVGVLDELNCALGVAAVCLDGAFQDEIRLIQARVFDMGAAAATGRPQPFWPREIDLLDLRTNELNECLEPLQDFVLPGGNEANARLHAARATSRRCERIFWCVEHEALLASGIGAFLNRLSDYLFVVARSVCDNEVIWQPLTE